MDTSVDPLGLEEMVVEVTRTIDAPIDAVWALLTDVERMAGLGPEHDAARWLPRDDGSQPSSNGPAVGDRFTGSNRRDSFHWEVICHVVEWEPPRRWSWTVLEPANASSTWSYELTEDGTRTIVSQRFQHGPGPSFVRSSVERDPERAAEVINGRSEMLRRNMLATLVAASQVLAEEHR